MSGPIRSVLVAGGGIAGWAAAAALKHHLPRLDVSLLALPVPAGALADRLACALPSLPGFLGDLGLGLGDGVARSGGGFRLGTRFTGWAAGEPPYIHAYGRVGQPFGPTSFLLHWLRGAAGGGAPAPFDAFSGAAALAAAGRLPAGAGEPFADVEPGLALTPDRFRAMLRAFALHRGVAEVAATLAGVEAAGDRIGAVRLGDGRALGADLFVDATGPAASLRSQLDDAWEDWRPWLPCDRLILGEGPPPAEPPLLAEAEALAAGWRWRAASPLRAEHGIVYSSAHLSYDAAAALLPVAGQAPVAVGAGTRPEPWRGNCVAVGDAATAIEPLEWCPLHLAVSAADRIVALLPGRDMAAVELAEYNRQALAEARRARDFVALHYCASRRPEPFWRVAAPPDSLAHGMALFRERGRLPSYPEETFSRDSWAAVLIGQGVRPRRVDPVTALVPSAEAADAMAGMIARLSAALPAQPPHAAVLAGLRRPGTR